MTFKESYSIYKSENVIQTLKPLTELYLQYVHAKLYTNFEDASGDMPAASDSADVEVEDDDLEMTEAEISTKCAITGKMYLVNAPREFQESF